MTNTSYVSVKTEELQTACELWLDERNTKIANKIEKEIQLTMEWDHNPWWKKKLKFKPKHLTYEEAFEYVHHAYIPFYGTIIANIGLSSKPQAKRIEKILYACKVPHYGFVNLSVEDNSILEGYYEQS